MEEITQWVQRTFDYEFGDTTLLERALTHRSAPGRSNERLEFLGDAVLDCVISDALISLRPDAEEGELSRLRSRLVRDHSLAQIARQHGLGEHLKLGSGEMKSGGFRRDSILADGLEALLGAIFRDGGYAEAERVVHRLYSRRLEHLPEGDSLKDPKTRLQEWLQARGLPLPAYELIGASGPAHDQRFEVRCRLVQPDGEATASGASRREAEQEAAHRLLASLTAGSPS
ncbi:ribonuclease III [Lentisalinibacter salinarum]|uniref:ribonuclease III n=1 Tax=Lentisalinibacter salinarum TaxID=2992239 RepID=UPI00386DDAE8